MSIRDTILEAADIATRTVDVPEWGVKLELREFDLDHRIRFDNARRAAEGDDNALAKVFAALVVAAVYDPETSEPVFKPEDAGLLTRRNGRVVNELAFEVMELNGMLEGAVDEGKADSSPTSPSGGDSESPTD